MTKEELEDRVKLMEDIHEIGNLQSRYNHYLSMGEFERVVELFSRKDQNVKVEIADSGVYQGIEGVERLFLKGMRERWFANKGSCPLMMIMTPIIEVSKDRKRAKGLWHSLGSITLREASGPQAIWAQGKYESEFVKENGKWKFRSLHWYVNFRSPFDQGWVKKPIVGSMTFADIKPDRTSTYYMPYNPDGFNAFLPGVPDPFE